MDGTPSGLREPVTCLPVRLRLCRLHRPRRCACYIAGPMVGRPPVSLVRRVAIDGFVTHLPGAQNTRGGSTDMPAAALRRRVRRLRRFGLGQGYVCWTTTRR